MFLDSFYHFHKLNDCRNYNEENKGCIFIFECHILFIQKAYIIFLNKL